MSLLDIMKRASIGAVESNNPVTILFGNVIRINPLEVNVHQRFTLTEDFLVVPESLTRYELDLKHNHSTSEGPTGEVLPEKIVIREGLQVGDRVLLIRVQGGQQYVVLDKVVT